MRGSDYAELETFLSVARHMSFRRASLERGMATSAVSHAIRKLEERVGVRLFNRTTRSVSLTDAGERLLSEVEPAFRSIGQALDGLNAYRETAFGTVRLTVSSTIAAYVLRDILGPLTRTHPGLHIEIIATDHLIDIVENGFDAGIRFGARLSQDMIAVKIRSGLRFAVVGRLTIWSAIRSRRYLRICAITRVFGIAFQAAPCLTGISNATTTLSKLRSKGQLQPTVRTL